MMAEIRHKVFSLAQFEERYRLEAFDKDCVHVITEDHTISDVLRFLADEAGGPEEVKHCLDRLEWP